MLLPQFEKNWSMVFGKSTKKYVKEHLAGITLKEAKRQIKLLNEIIEANILTNPFPKLMKYFKKAYDRENLNDYTLISQEKI
jgi:hypothetical protein